MVCNILHPHLILRISWNQTLNQLKLSSRNRSPQSQQQLSLLWLLLLQIIDSVCIEAQYLFPIRSTANQMFRDEIAH